MAKQKQQEPQKLPEQPVQLPEPALVKPSGTQIAKVKKDVALEMPDGTPDERALRANELCKERGFAYQFTHENVLPSIKGERTTRRSQDTGSREPSLADLLALSEVAKETEGGVAGLVERLGEVVTLAERVGGISQLRACLDALAKLSGSNGD